MSLARELGNLAGAKALKQLQQLGRGPPNTSGHNRKPGAGAAFVGGVKRQLLSNEALAEYARLATKATGAPLNSQKNFYRLLKALTNVNAPNRGNRAGAATRQLVQKIVLPRLEGPGPPPNPVVNDFINQLKSVNLNKTFEHISPQHHKNLVTIVKKAVNISRPNRPNRLINAKRVNSEELGAALARIIDRTLAQIHKEGPIQPTREGVIIGGVFKGLRSQNKNGTATWASKFLANQLGNRNLNPELKRILLTLVRQPENKNQQVQQFIKNAIIIYEKMPNSKKYFSTDFLKGLRVLKNLALHPMTAHAAKTLRNSLAANKSVMKLLLTAISSTAASTPQFRQMAANSARKFANTVGRGVAGLGRWATNRNQPGN
jgi:hypothetical protein